MAKPTTILREVSVRFLAQKQGVEQGQSTIEFAIVTVALLCVFTACSALWRFFEKGALVQHALTSASHNIDGALLGCLADVFLY